MKDTMKNKFRVHDCGNGSNYLWVYIVRNQEHYTIDIVQNSYMRLIIAMFTLHKSRPVVPPIAMDYNKRKPTEEG
jgi:hypothetical protein